MEGRQLYQFYQNTIKICVIGSSRAGKSSLVEKFYDRSFSDFYSPTNIIDYKIKYIGEDENFFILHTLDLADNNESFSFYQIPQGFFIVFNLTHRRSFREVKTFIDRICRYSTEKHSIVLIGSKCDIQSDREVAYEEGKELADQYDMMYLEVSSKNGFNVNLAFELLYTSILARSKVNY